MKKLNFLAAIAAIVFAGCTNDDFVGDVGVTTPVNPQEVPIVFSSLKNNFTRADSKGAEAAALLNNKFVVSGYKGTWTEWGKSSTTSTKVFDNYLVEYRVNTANTTESNTDNWEYVGVTPIAHATTNGIVSQTIKYWDYSQSQYDFIAWSTGMKPAVYSSSELADGKVYVTAIDPTNAKTAAFTFSGKAVDLQDCYVADLVTVKKSSTTAGNKYGDPVTLTFRSLGTKVRIGIYETVPGYSVRNVKFYTQGGVLTDVSTEITDNATIFSTAADIYTEGTYTVSYPSVDDESNSDNNMAHISFAPKGGVSQTTVVDWGTLDYTIAEAGEQTPGKVYLGRTSNTATFAGNAATNYYVTYLPNETGTNLNLRVNFTLESTDGSGEVINVKNAKAQIPLIYATWKPGYAYTYLFKISDATNGRTGNYDPTKTDDDTYNSDPAGLYPITFDAVVVNSEENTQETITTISTPSITTYQKGSVVVDNDEYLASKGKIFVTVNEDNAMVTLTAANAALYTLSDERAYTEADVVDALSYRDDNAAASTIKGRSGLVLTEAANTLVKVIDGPDGNTITLDATNNMAMEFTPTAPTSPATVNTYAFVYTKTASTSENVFYEAYPFASFASGATKYRYDYKAATTTDAQEGVQYFVCSGTGAAGDPYICTSTVASTFVGQNVSNLYLDVAGNTIASGYAVTGTTYYYTTDNGMTYKQAHNVAYATTNWLQGLYEEDTTPGTYKATSDAAPATGKAYYYLDGTDYVYCVFLPQQTTGWCELDTTKYVEATEISAVTGQTYFDKYTKNNGVYYTKVIKVQ